MRLQLNHADTLSDHRDWEGEIRVVKSLSNIQKQINLMFIGPFIIVIVEE